MELEEERLLAGDTNDPSIDVEAFTEQHGLQDRIQLFRKAAQLANQDQGSQRDTIGLTSNERAALLADSTHRFRQPFLLYICILCTALGAIGQGFAQTSMNGATLYYPSAFKIGSNSTHNTLLVGVINSGIYLSNGVLGAWLVAPLNDRLGRRGTVFLGAIISLIFNIASANAMSWQALLTCRLILGLGLALLSTTLNVFAAECAPPSIRGGLGVAWQMSCAFGIFLSFLTNMAIDGDPETVPSPLQWRAMLLSAAAPAIPLMVFIYICPESPSWLIKSSGRYDLAFESLSRLRNNDLIAARDLLTLYHPESKTSTTKTSLLTSLTDLFTIPRLRRATLASYTTMLSQQLCGINVVAFYSSSIFVKSGYSPHVAEVASVIFGLVNFLGAIPAIWAMDSWGRRSLLLVTLPPMAVSMVVAGTSFSLPDSSAGLRFGLSTSMIYLFCLLYSPGMGPVPAAYSAEVFPLSHREVGTSSSVAFTNLFAAILSLTFPYLLSVLGTSGAFVLYGILNVVAWILVFLFVPETKRLSLEQLDDVFAVPTRTYVQQNIADFRRRARRKLTRDSIDAMD